MKKILIVTMCLVSCLFIGCSDATATSTTKPETKTVRDVYVITSTGEFVLKFQNVVCYEYMCTSNDGSIKFNTEDGDYVVLRGNYALIVRQQKLKE